MRRMILALALGLAACGGGGGGGGGSSGPPAGAFTLSASSATFSVLQNAPLPADASLAMTITGSGVAFVGAAYTGGQTQPFWLGIDIVGSGNSYSVVISILSTSVAPGSYSSTFSVGTANANQDVLQSQSVTVTYTVTPRITISQAGPTYNVTYGDGSTTQPHTVDVVAPNRQWTAASDASWLQIPSGTQNGNAALQAVSDLGSLDPGQYVGHITVTSAADPTDTATQTVTVNVTSPILTVGQAALVIGGPDGQSVDPVSLPFSLAAGGATHPYALSITTDSGGDWLDADLPSGFVGSGGATVELTADPAGLAGGTYTGTVEVTVTVNSIVLNSLIPVTLNLEANRIVVGAEGVLLSSSPGPGRSVLTRDVTVFSSVGREDVPWDAVDDQAWLTATATGETGDAITLVADPTGLAVDTTYFATVTVSSSDASVENTQTIRVGFHINSAAPADLSNTLTAHFLAASPVEPVVFIHTGGSDVVGYDVYTGAVVRTFAGAVATAGKMIVSDDGHSLFIYDATNIRVTEVDATSGAFVHHYDSFLASGTPTGLGLGYIRPAGHRILITPSARMYDVDTGDEYYSQDFTAPSYSSSLHASADGRYVVNDAGAVFELVRTALNGGDLLAAFEFGAFTAQGAAGEACIRSDGAMIYTASGAPYNFPGTSFATHQVEQVLPGIHYPNSMLCLWNGVVIGGSSSIYELVDVFIYDGPSGVQLATRSSSSSTMAYRELRARGMAASGDATRLISLTRGLGGNVDEARFQSIPGPP